MSARLVTWLLLVALAVASVLLGELRGVLLLAGVKAALLGFQFMELRDAARAHLAAYVGFVAVVVGVLEVLTR